MASLATHPVVAAALALALAQTPLHAQTRLPLGGRTAAMGGAAAAAGRDAAMPFVNPAGFARVPHHTVSLSASLYRHTSLDVERYFFHGNVDDELGQLLGNPSAVEPGLTATSFESFPGALSVLLHLGDEGGAARGVHHVLSASVLVPRHDYESYEGDFALAFEGGTVWRQRSTLVSRTSEHLVGPGYALRVGPLCFGASAFVSYRTAVRSSAETITVSLPAAYFDDDFTAFSESEAFGLALVLGAQWQLTRALSVGLAVAPETLPLGSTAVTQSFTRGTGPVEVADATFLQAQRGEGTIEVVAPTRVRGGVAYAVPARFGLTLDLELELGRSAASRQRFELTSARQTQGEAAVVSQTVETLSADREPVLNVYGGGEYYLSPSLALRAGAFYEPSPLPALRERIDDVLRKRVDRVGITAGVGFESEVGETTLGLAVVIGSGETMAPDAFADAGTPRFARTDVRELSATVFVSGAVDLEELSSLAKMVTDPEAAFGAARTVVKLGELSPELARFEGDAVIDALASRPVSYLRTDHPAYDRFFADVARLRALVEVTRGLLARVADEAPVPTEVAARVEALRALARALSASAQTIARLPSEARALAEAARGDFRSARAVVLPAVLANLAEAQADLLEVAAALPDLAAALERAIARVASLPSPVVPALSPLAPFDEPFDEPGQPLERRPP